MGLNDGTIECRGIGALQAEEFEGLVQVVMAQIQYRHKYSFDIPLTAPHRSVEG